MPLLRHRLAAGAALILGPLATVLIVVGVVRSMPGLLVGVVTGVIAVWCVWKAVVHRMVRRWAYGVAAAILAVATIVDVVWVASQLPLLFSGLALAVSAVALARFALASTRRPDATLVGAARHPALLVNPHSGGGAADDAGVAEAARERGISVTVLGPDDDLGALALAAVKRGADCLGMAGGDGSLAVVAEVAMRYHLPFVCVPAGTRNHFALDLGLDRSDLIGALDAFGPAAQRRVDVGRVNGRLFLNNVSLGLYGEVVADDAYRDNKMAVVLERIPDVLGPESSGLDLQFVDGDGEQHRSASVVHVSNNAYQISPGAGFGSRPSLCDGELGVVATVDGASAGAGRVLQWQAPSFTLESAGPVAAGVDGEAVELAAPVEFRVEPARLKVRTSREAVGVSPAAKKVSFTVATARGLMAVASGAADER